MDVFDNILSKKYRPDISLFKFDISINESSVYLKFVQHEYILQNIYNYVLYLDLINKNTNINFPKYLLYLRIHSNLVRTLIINSPYLLFLDLRRIKLVNAECLNLLIYLNISFDSVKDTIKFLPYNSLYLCLSGDIIEIINTFPPYLLYLDIRYCWCSIKSKLVIPKSLVHIFKSYLQ